MHPVKYLIYSAFAVYLTTVSYFGYELYSRVNELSQQATEIVEQFNKLPKAIPNKVLPSKPKPPKVHRIPKLGPFPDGGSYLWGK